MLVRSFSTALLAAAAVLVGSAAPPAMAGDGIKIGGWAGFAYTDNDKDGSVAGFDAHPWYLNFQGTPTEDYQFFGEIEFEHVFEVKGASSGAQGSGELKVERLYLERNLGAAHNFRAGKFFMPFGYWYRLHWHFLTETLSRPYSFNAGSTPRQQIGLQYFGRRSVGGNQVKYYAWVGNGPDVFGANNRTTDGVGYGGSLYVEHRIGNSPKRYLGGTVAYHGQQVGMETASEEQRNLVGGANVSWDRVEVRSEWYRHTRETSADVSNWYAMATAWLLPRAGLTWRMDGGDDPKGAGSAVDTEATSHSFGAIWRPEARVLVKAEYRMNDFSDPSVSDFAEWNSFFALSY